MTYSPDEVQRLLDALFTHWVLVSRPSDVTVDADDLELILGSLESVGAPPAPVAVMDRDYHATPAIGPNAQGDRLLLPDDIEALLAYLQPRAELFAAWAATFETASDWPTKAQAKAAERVQVGFYVNLVAWLRTHRWEPAHLVNQTAAPTLSANVAHLHDVDDGP